MGSGPMRWRRRPPTRKPRNAQNSALTAPREIRAAPAMAGQHSEFERISRRYANFAVDEARGASEIYERIALAVAASPNLLAFLVGLPVDRLSPISFLPPSGT